MKTSTTKKGRVLEAAVAEVYAEQSPFIVQRNVLAPSRFDPSRFREVDVLVADPQLPHFLCLPIECKNYKRPVGVGKIDEFAGKLDDIGLRREGSQFVSDRGFTKDALSRAKTLKIETLVLEGLTPDRLKSRIFDARGTSIYPVLFLHGYSLNLEQFETSVIDPMITRDQCDCYLNVLSGKYIFVADLFHQIWNEEALLPTEPGIHNDCIVEPQHDLILNWQGRTCRVKSICPKLEVRAFAAVQPGQGTNLQIKRAQDKALVRSRRQAQFPSYVDLPLTEFRSPQALLYFVEQQRLQGDADWHFSRQVKVPRVYFGGHFWPLSRRVKRELKKTRARDLDTLHSMIADDLQKVGWEK